MSNNRVDVQINIYWVFFKNFIHLRSKGRISLTDCIEIVYTHSFLQHLEHDR